MADSRSTVPRRIFCLWVGSQPMSRNRENALYTIQTNTGVRVEVVRDENLEDYILPEHPLHDAYEYLSGTHKADYLRAYLMHHHGGGYTDIKYTFHSWIPCFEELERGTGLGPEKWAVGYREVGADGVAWVEDEVLQTQLTKNWSRLLGNGAYICKPRTPFTETWLRSAEATLERYYDELIRNPAQGPRDARGRELPNGSVSKYPIRWSYLHGSMFHPACLKYADHLLYGLPQPIFVGYL